MNDEREYDFTSLSQRISAQTEAYVQFSNALVKIIEQTAAIRDNLSSTNDQLDEECAKLQELLIDLNRFYSENVNQHNLYAKDLETLKNKFHDFENKLKEFHDDSSGSHKALIESVAKISTHSIKTLEQNNTMLSFLKDSKKTNDKLKVFLWALTAVMSVFFVLSGLHIVNVTWWLNK